MAAIVAIVGRPNVGKSTLFNRITKSKKALVDDRPGVTRDRNYARAAHEGHEFVLIDTGGFSDQDPDDYVEQIQSQARQAIAEADAVCMVFDGKQGLSPYDRDLLDILRPLEKPVFYCVNKIDGPEQEHLVSDFAALGVDGAYPISSEHGFGIMDFLDDLVAALPDTQTSQEKEMIRVAVVGRPNAGKSSLINRVLGQERLLVSNTPGTTRDAVDTVCKVNGKSYLLVDTAGIRRKGRVTAKLEKFSVIRALKSLEQCDVALILLDASEGVTDQDVHVAGYAQDRGCGCIWVANKWDLANKERSFAKDFEKRLREEAKFLHFAPFVTVSAKTGQRVSRIFKMVDEVYAQYSARISTGPLNRILSDAVARHEPPMVKAGRRVKFYYATQASTRPPTFIFFVNYPASVHFSYSRYLVNTLREEAGLDKTPVRLFFRERGRRDLKELKEGPHRSAASDNKEP